MNKVPFKEYKDSLIGKGQQVIDHLVPGISLRGGYYEAGDLDGAPGRSLKINSQSLVWEDFATGEKGDIIELFRVKYGKQFIREIESFLGISNTTTQHKTMVPKKDWASIEDGDEVYKYLDGRGLSAETVNKFSRFIKKKNNDIVYLCGTKEKGLIYAHYKSMSKSHSPFGTKDSDKCLWGDDHSEHPKENVVITEGMEDAMSFIEQGCDVISVSVPCGANNTKWSLLSSEWLKGFRKIYIATDTDEPGNQLADFIVSAFGSFKCSRVSFGAYKDANDFHLNDSSGEGLKKCLEDAVELRPKSIMNLEDVVKYREAKKGNQPPISIPLIDWSEFGWRLRLSELTVVTGETTCGKSTILYNAAAYHALTQEAIVGIVSPELDPDDIMDNLASISSGERFSEIQLSKKHEQLDKLSDRCKDLIHIVNADGDRSQKTLFKWLDYFARLGANIIIVDALQDLHLDMYDNTRVMEFMRKMQQFTKDSRAHVFLTAHTRKQQGEADFGIDNFPSTNQILGSNTIGTMAFNILAVVRNTKKQDIMLDPHASNEDREGVTGQADGGIKVIKDKKEGRNKGNILYYNIEPESKRLLPEQRKRIVTPWI